VERGRNIVSASRDGTARLWDCGKSTCLAKYAADSVINGCSLHTPPASIDLLQPDHVPGIVFTAASNKLITRMWANANVLVALPNIGGALCSTPQFG